MSSNETPSGITRRSAVAGAISLAALAGGAKLGAITPKKPNILFIMADDLGYADLSCYGRRDYETPNIDKLAKQGTRFTQAYANSAVCTATRVALITGRYQYRIEVGLQEPLRSPDIGLSPDHPTIASLLQDQGYKTSLIGKWHMGHLPKFGPLKSGYDEFWGIRGGAVDYFTHDFGDDKDLWDGTTRIEETGYLTRLLADRTIETLDDRGNDGKPFFISLHFTAPHWPWEGPDDREESDRLASIGSREAIFHFDGGTQKTYAEIVKALDMQVGRVLDKLTDLGMDDNTIVVFTSDNGGERFSDVWPFTGRKTELLEGGLRIPAIVRWPGLSNSGTISHEQIMSMDWFPTLLAAAGGTPHPDYPVDGIDIRKAISGGTLAERTLYWRFNNHGQEAARRGDWKYLKIAGNTFLFDVAADPLERGNLKGRYPDIYADLRQKFAGWNQTMLHDPNAFTHGFTARGLADHFGVDD